MRRFAIIIMALTMLAAPAAFAGETPSAPGAAVYFITPSNGAMMTNPVTIKFGLKGMGIAPAGVEQAKTGHHHLLIDTDMPKGEDLDYALPADENVRHFGGGQTETTLDLPKGTHTLQLLLGDANHIPHNPPILSEKITVTVK